MSSEFLNIQEIARANVSRGREMFNKLPLVGIWKTQHYRGGKLLDEFFTKNDITTAAKNALFNTMFNAATQVPSGNWCAGLINNAAFTGYDPANTMAAHSGWTEWTAYSQTSRVAWGQGAAAAAAITNATPMQFDINGTGVVRGLFMTSENTKGGTAGLLWSAASYSSTVDVVPGDQIRSTYSLSC